MQSLWMLVATFLFSVMGLCVKLVSVNHGTGEIVFYRGLIGALAVFTLCRIRRAPLRTPHARLHIKRSAVGLVSMCLWFYTLVALPLPTAMTLAYTSPLWAGVFVLLASLRPAGRPLDRRAAAIPLCGFVGVALLLQPTFDRDLWGAGVLGIIGAIFAALAYWQVRAIARAGEPEWRIVFYFSLGTAIVGLLWALPAGMHWPDPRALGLLIAIGVSALAAQFALTRALSRGNTLTAVTLQYSGVLFAVMWGMLFWGDRPGILGWFSMALIVSSGIASAWIGSARPVRQDGDACGR